jgi:hypothetical protein
MRSPRPASWSLLACAAALAGCVGQPTSTPPDADRPVRVDARLADGPLPDGMAEFMCRDKITAGLESGRHRPGENCQQGCHNHGFSMSGTLYTAADSTTPVVGASITFIDANGVTGDMRSNLNGNFWWSLPVAFPVKIIASMCPDVAPMVAMVQESGGGCNQAGCHSASGGVGRVHLP